MGIQLFKWGRDMLIHVIKTLIYQLILYDQSRLKDLPWRGNHHSWGLKIKAVGVGSIFVFYNAFLNGVSFFECRLNPRKDDRVSEDPPTIFSKIHDEINNTLRWIINANLSRNKSPTSRSKSNFMPQHCNHQKERNPLWMYYPHPLRKTSV